MRDERKLQAKIVELRRTIMFLCNSMDNASDLIDKNPALAKLILKDAQNDQRHEFK